MFVIIETGGKQYKVAVGQKLKLEKLSAQEGDNFSFDKVLLLVGEHGTGTRNGVEVKIGTPYIPGAKAEAKVLRQGRADKVIVFKYHSKTRYRKKKGHRQPFTEIQITNIKI